MNIKMIDNNHYCPVKDERLDSNQLKTMRFISFDET